MLHQLNSFLQVYQTASLERLAKNNFKILQNSILLLYVIFTVCQFSSDHHLSAHFSSIITTKAPFKSYRDVIFFLQQAALTESSSDTKHCLQLLWKYIYLYPVVKEAKDQGIRATCNNLCWFERTFQGNIRMYSSIKIRLVSKALVTQGMILREWYFNQY